MWLSRPIKLAIWSLMDIQLGRDIISLVEVFCPRAVCSNWGMAGHPNNVKKALFIDRSGQNPNNSTKNQSLKLGVGQKFEIFWILRSANDIFETFDTKINLDRRKFLLSRPASRICSVIEILLQEARYIFFICFA